MVKLAKLETVQARVTSSEKQLIGVAAAKADMTVSEWLRHVALAEILKSKKR